MQPTCNSDRGRGRQAGQLQQPAQDLSTSYPIVGSCKQLFQQLLNGTKTYLGSVVDST